MTDNTIGILGRGWAFPPAFTLNSDAQGSSVVLAQDVEDIRQSLRILFSTLPGERVMRPDYGCDLNAQLFENISADLLAQIRRTIADSILRYEPRVELTEVTARQNAQQPTRLDIHVNYRLRGGGESGQLFGTLDMASGAGAHWS